MNHVHPKRVIATDLFPFAPGNCPSWLGDCSGWRLARYRALRRQSEVAWQHTWAKSDRSDLRVAEFLAFSRRPSGVRPVRSHHPAMADSHVGDSQFI